MRKLVVWNVMTLDGYFEGEEAWDLRFHETIWGDEMQAFSDRQTAEVGALIFGRRTYEGMMEYWSAQSDPTAIFMNGILKYVASDTLERAEWNNSTLLQGDVVKAIGALKAEPGKDLFIFGSADLVADLLPTGLIDEYRVAVAPVLLGGGTPLFRPMETPINMRLLDCEQVGSSAVILRYALT
ncbi:dihydrofolate reductase [Paracoccus caeni]|uniref:Dihydrofolate reductase n=1 Tax=Paracoccus caeni TaxID=657651 RepID=A0A934SE85_9RHOB|nr:dihydrofolate reductase family protein [Paracoccus caeni]MBK4216053.1 dihydrofolate reductase [Paracoccus caeni]